MTRKELEKKFESLYHCKPSSNLTKKQLEYKILNADMYGTQDKIFKDIISQMYK